MPKATGTGVVGASEAIGVVISERARDGIATDEVRSSLSSLEVGVKRFAYAIPGYRCLNVATRAAESRIWEPHRLLNFAWLDLLTLSALTVSADRDDCVMK